MQISITQNLILSSNLNDRNSFLKMNK